MPKKRINDAQVERLLYALKTDLKFRQNVAHRIAQRDDIKYDSAMRRLQRYITDAGEKRSFASSPKVYQRELRQETRILRPEVTRAPRVERKRERYEPSYEDEIDTGYLRAVVAYHDGDQGETSDALGLNQREERLLGLANRGINVLNMPGGGFLAGKTQDFLLEIGADADDIRDFHDFLMDQAEWKVNMVLKDIADGYTTFADWIDLYRDAGNEWDQLEKDPEYWKLFRAAYKRTGKLSAA